MKNRKTVDTSMTGDLDDASGVEIDHDDNDCDENHDE